MEKNLKQIINEILNNDKIIDKGNALVPAISRFVGESDPQRAERQQVVINYLKEDDSALDSSMITLLIQSNVITFEQLEKQGIDHRFIDALRNGLSRPRLDSVKKKLEKVTNEACTEVYFWGIPSSGKTCAIGAILSMLKSGHSRFVKNIFMKECQGYDYMNRLSSIFKVPSNKDKKDVREVTMLPTGNAVTATYEMGFDMIDKRNRHHPITFIDMAGELIRIMYKSFARHPLSVDEKDALNTVNHILVDNRSQNRKIHFFVLEYGGGQRAYEGLTQDSYLIGAMNYIMSMGIFKDFTDGIYLLITKADKTKKDDSQLKEYLEDYITQKGYKGFCESLKSLCREHHINDGEIIVFAFSLGQVCFKDYCLFDSKYTDDVIKELVKRTWSESAWRYKWWGRPFKGIVKLLKS